MRTLSKVTAPGAGARWLVALKSPVGAVSAVMLFLVLALAVAAPILWSGQAEEVNTKAILQGPSAEHLVGTDSLGRDLFFRLLVATGLSVKLALAATGIGVLAGLALGTVPSLVGRRAGRIVTAFVNIAVAFPGLLLAMFFAVIFGVGETGAVLAIGFATAPSFARLTQTLVATQEERDFIAAAKMAGVGKLHRLFRHILPNIAEPLVVTATIGAGGSLLAFAGLSFLGLGVQPPAYDWGRLLNEGLNSIYVHPMAALAPTMAVVIAGLAFNLFGEAVAKALGTPTGITGTGTAPQRVLAPTVVEPSSNVQTAPVEAHGAVLTVTDLFVSFPGPNGPITPVRGVSFSLARGEAVGMVGESGSGKTQTALALAQLVEYPGQVKASRLEFLGQDQLSGTSRARRQLLGTSFAMVFQDPMKSFNPTMRIGMQLAEVAMRHQGMNRRQALTRAVDRLRAVRVPAADRRLKQYPHEFSGGMRQRAMIGMGIMGCPALIVADEPTTALDVTVQQQVLRLLSAIREKDNVAMLLISHDLTLVGQVCDRVLVMYAGRIVEDLPASDLKRQALHPYTQALLAAVPDMDTDRERPLAVVPGRPADPSQLPGGCAFAARCAKASEQCVREDPVLVQREDGHRVACWHPSSETDPRLIPVELKLHAAALQGDAL
ncbi:Peptide ABC transporter ATP-binding protein [Arthrobacter sp. 9V]|uniref:dipeptide/oligopeptide/nickel ABC transporter permease/ATP-binding protein n=1 Tax=Arthrobacter sp. 9V TaxID=2653132 RepID=UPI0012EF3B10|nr:dipeptide/oligopeptide/nickel ABC transporter permease/ATP-binding protein [Arthrobacter sp. 9V]VXB50701.1 Peptide ABC transporter ATP-binding protein [Arthrobacter sp. 9V]